MTQEQKDILVGKVQELSDFVAALDVVAPVVTEDPSVGTPTDPAPAPTE